MIIPEMITCAINDYVLFNGTEIVMGRSELYDLVNTKFSINYGSFMPQDYCYNRSNNGIVFKDQPHLFEYTGRNKYRLLGNNYPYTGPIMHKERGSNSEKIIGKWEAGVVKMYF